MRYETATVNGATFYELDTPQSVSSVVHTRNLAACSSEYVYLNGDSSPLQWTPTPSGTHYTTIDEAYSLPYDDADYISSTETEPVTPARKKDRFTHAALATANPIALVQVTVRRKGSGGINVGFVIGGTFYSQYISSGTSSFAYATVLFYTNPATGLPWTKAALDAAYVQVEQAGVYGNVATISQLYLRVYYYTDASVTWGFQVWKRSGAPADTELTAGVQTLMTKTVSAFLDEGAQLRSTTWACSGFALDPADSIVVGLYTKVGAGSWLLHSTYRFSTEVLGAQSLDAATWTLYFYLEPDVTVSYVRSNFRWGSSSYLTRIEGFTWTETSGQSLTFTFNEQLIITASQSTGKAKSLQLGDSLTVLGSVAASKALAFTASTIILVYSDVQLYKALSFVGCDMILVSDSSESSVGLMFSFSEYGLLIIIDGATQSKALEFSVGDYLTSQIILIGFTPSPASGLMFVVAVGLVFTIIAGVIVSQWRRKTRTET